MSVITPLKKAKHLGAAKSGTSHYVHQRVTALFLLPLLLWFVVTMLSFFSTPMSHIPYMMTHPLNIFAAILFIGVMLFHGKLGMQVVIEDYVHSPFWRNTMLLLLEALCWVSVVAGVVAVVTAQLLFRTL